MAVLTKVSKSALTFEQMCLGETKHLFTIASNSTLNTMVLLAHTARIACGHTDTHTGQLL